MYNYVPIEIVYVTMTEMTMKMTNKILSLNFCVALDGNVVDDSRGVDVVVLIVVVVVVGSVVDLNCFKLQLFLPVQNEH